jgi:hypothetical protein
MVIWFPNQVSASLAHAGDWMNVRVETKLTQLACHPLTVLSGSAVF